MNHLEEVISVNSEEISQLRLEATRLVKAYNEQLKEFFPNGEYFFTLNFHKKAKKEFSLEKIQAFVEGYYRHKLETKSRKADHVEAKYVAAWVMCCLTSTALKVIANYSGYKGDHSGVIHAKNKVIEFWFSDENFRFRLLNFLERMDEFGIDSTDCQLMLSNYPINQK